MYRQEIKLAIESKLLNIEILSNAIRGICQGVINDEVIVYQTILCLVEATTNVMIHAYHRQPNHLIEIHVVVDRDYISLEIVDDGEKAPALSVPQNHNEFSGDPLSLQESGRGLFLIHSFMDDVSYKQNEEGKNVFKMVKRLEGGYRK